MIKLIVGLGNPGSQYQKTRHNAGFLFLDGLCEQLSASWGNEVKFHGHVARSQFRAEKVLLLKPQTFMNKSGMSVGAVARYYKIEPEEILVVHDELDLAVGVVRLKKGGGHAGHNGLRDIIANLGAKDFYRLRMGIGRPAAGSSVSDFVLSSPAKQEWADMQSAFDLAEAYMAELVQGEVAAVMNALNKR